MEKSREKEITLSRRGARKDKGRRRAVELETGLTDAAGVSDFGKKTKKDVLDGEDNKREVRKDIETKTSGDEIERGNLEEEIVERQKNIMSDSVWDEAEKELPDRIEELYDGEMVSRGGDKKDSKMENSVEENIEEAGREVSKKKYTAEEVKSMEATRAASDYTLRRIKNYEDLLDKNKTVHEKGKDEKGNEIDIIRTETSEKESDELFLEKTRQIWSEFTVHGFPKRDKKGNEIPDVVDERTDLDGRAAIELLRLAGIKNVKVKYVKQGAFEEGKINIDTGGREGVVSEDEGYTLIVDHHGEESGLDFSATKHMYELLVDMGLLKKEEYLDKLVEFVTKEDNKTYYPSELEKNFKRSYATLLGLEKHIDIKTIFNLLKGGYEKLKKFDPAYNTLPKSFLESYQIIYGKNKKVPLAEISEKRKKSIERSVEALKKMEKEGFVIDTKNDNNGGSRYGKIVIDIINGKNRSVELGYDAAVGCGYQGYLIWSPESQSFFLSTLRPIEEDFPQGFKLRGRMWMKPRGDGEPLKVSLKEVLEILAGGKFEVKGKLKKYLEQESERAKKAKDDSKRKAVVEDGREKEKDIEEKELNPEDKKRLRYAVSAYTEEAKKYSDFLGRGILRKISGKTEQERMENLKLEVENFVAEGLKKHGNETQKEIKYICQEVLKNIFDKNKK